MVKHPRILIATDNTENQINGVVVTYKQLAAQAGLAGYEMHFLDPDKFPHFSLPQYKEIKLALPFGIRRQIEHIRPQYIHIATEGPIGLATKLYCDRRGIPYNTSYHTKFPEYFKQLYGIPTKYTYKYMRWFHKHSGRVLTTTKSMRETLLANGFLDNIVEWTRGVDRTRFQGLIRTPAQKTQVLFVGRLSKEKNIGALLALQDDFDITIVGDGPERAGLEHTYPRAKFVGYKTGAELFQYYLNADVFCFPSRTDTFGIVLVEALAAGTPVAAYPVTGPIDIIESGVTGYLGDDLKQNIELCLRLDRAIICERSQDWTWENCWQIFERNLCRSI